MGHNLIYNLVHMPIVWDFLIPIVIIAIFCVILMWEGEFGKATRKRFKLAFKKGGPNEPTTPQTL